MTILHTFDKKASLSDFVTYINQIPFDPNKVYGTYRNLRGNKLKEYHEKFILTPLQKDVLIGTMLGDGTMGLQKTKIANPGMALKCEQKDQAYLTLLYMIFEDFIGPPILLRYVSALELTRLNKSGQKIIKSYSFRTYHHDVFQFYVKEFYEIDANGNRRKKVPKLIHRWLNAQSLAIWFQDDGKKTDSGYNFATHSFYLYEVKRLQAALQSVFSFEVTIQKDKIRKGDGEQMYTLYIGAKSRDAFTALVKPNMVLSKQYKLHPLSETNQMKSKIIQQKKLV